MQSEFVLVRGFCGGQGSFAEKESVCDVDVVAVVDECWHKDGAYVAGAAND